MRFKNKEIAAAWLAGMIDGEGHVRHGIRQDGRRTISRYKCITITNTDIGLLEACQEAMDMLGISYHKHLKPTKKDDLIRKPCYALWISAKENLEKVQKLVPIQCHYKVEALDIAIKSYVTDKKELGKRISEGKMLANKRKRELGLPLRVNKQT